MKQNTLKGIIPILYTRETKDKKDKVWLDGSAPYIFQILTYLHWLNILQVGFDWSLKQWI